MLYFFKIEKDTWKNQNFEKMKKLLDISFYTCVPKTKIIWGSAVSEIEWDRQIFCTFALFFALLPQKIKAYDDVIILYMCTKKSPSYGVWLLRYGCNHTIFCYFGSFFALLLHYWPQILKIEKKRRYFLFHMCTINKDYRDIRHNRLKFLSFWTIFCPFFPLTNQNIKILRKWKKNPGDIIHMSTTNDNHMMYGSWDMEFNRQNLFSFWTFFCSFTAWRYHQLTLVYHKWQTYDVWFLRYKVQRTEIFVDCFLPFWPLLPP